MATKKKSKSEDDDKYISHSELAKLCGVGKTTVGDWTDKGVLPVEIMPDGQRKIVRELGIKFAKKHQIENTQAFKKQALTSEFNKAKAVSETYKARMAKVQYEEKIKSLIKVETVEKRLFELALEVRDAIMTIPNRISPVLASMTSEKKINIYLEKILTDSLTSISKGEMDNFKETKLK